MEKYMRFEQDIADLYNVVKKLQMNDYEIISDEAVISAMSVLNFIKYNKVPDAFLGCAALNLINAYVKQDNSKLNYSFKRHLCNILKGIEDIQQPKSIQIYYDPINNQNIIYIVFGDFQFSYKAARFSTQVKRLLSKKTVEWDGIRKQHCAKTIFDFVFSSEYISNETLGGSDLRLLVNNQIKYFHNGGLIFNNGKLIKKEGIKYGNDEKDLYLKDYLRTKLYECTDRPVIVSGIFTFIHDKHVTFTSIQPYIPGIKCLTICDHINILRRDIEKVIDLNSLEYNARYYIIGYCKSYGIDRMGINLAINYTHIPIFGIHEFSKMPKDIFSDCHRFSIEDYIRKDQVSYKF